MQLLDSMKNCKYDSAAEAAAAAARTLLIGWLKSYNSSMGTSFSFFLSLPLRLPFFLPPPEAAPLVGSMAMSPM
jgi:hypothetical protein